MANSQKLRPQIEKDHESASKVGKWPQLQTYIGFLVGLSWTNLEYVAIVITTIIKNTESNTREKNVEELWNYIKMGSRFCESETGTICEMPQNYYHYKDNNAQEWGP